MSTAKDEERTARIRELNNLLRETMIGRVVITEGICSQSYKTREEIITAVREFNDFSEANDPHGEHDFGAFDHPEAGKIFWKIDYYGLTFDVGSEDPADPKKTRRVLTIFLASEY